MTAMEDFVLEEAAFIELNRLLKVLGLCDSGGAANMAVSAGRVLVNDAVESRKRRKIRPGDVVHFEGRHIRVQAAAGPRKEAET